MSSGSPHTFFAQLGQAFEKAVAASSKPLERVYAIAGHSIRLRFAGPALLTHVTRAITHLATAPVRKPALTICIWDSCSTHTPIPSPAWGLDSYRSSGEIREFTTERFFTGFQLGAGILGMVDLERGLGFYWIRSAAQVPAYESAAPLRLVLYPWLHAHHTLAIHAGAVGLPEGGVLLAGPSGSGKSSTALACLTSDLFYTADDFCLVNRECPLTVFSLYSTAKLHQPGLQRLPQIASLAADAEPRDGEKAIVYLGEQRREKLLNHFPLKAIFIPRVTHRAQTQLQPASPAAALSALTSGTLLLLPHAARETFHALSEMVRQVPCFYLQVGTDLAQIPIVIHQWLTNGGHS